jgi:hypothetical protein
MSIREVCSCGAEIETDLPEQVELVKAWRKNHKHQADKPERKDTSILSDNQVALGFKAEDTRYEEDE